MFASTFTALLTLMLMGGPAVAVPGATTCQTGVQHVELPAVPAGDVPTVCISPEQATTLSFETEFLRESLMMEGRERFASVHVSESTLKLVPSERLIPGEFLKVTVRFRDGDAPASAALWLVVHPVQAATHVEVHREKRPVKSFQRELREKDAALQQCLADTARLLGERSGPGGILALRAAGIMDSNGVTGHIITESVVRAATNALKVRQVTAFRSTMRVAVEVHLIVSENVPPWKPEGAMLTLQGKKGVELKMLTVWPLEPIAPGTMGGIVFVEAEAPTDATKGSYTLKLWEEGGARTVTLSGITFQ